MTNGMLCKIADLITVVPETGGLTPRCKEYLYDKKSVPDIVIRADRYHAENWPGLSDEIIAYMESGYQFNGSLLLYNGLMLHSSAVEYEGKAYLFSGPCGIGKSTHARLWQSLLGDGVQVFNDDKPAIRSIDGRWFAYGTPWCGKEGIHQNKKVPLAGICFLKQAPHNRIRRLDQPEAIRQIIPQTIHRFVAEEMLDRMLNRIEDLVKAIPVYELENRPEADAARLSYEAMRRGAEEIGL